MTNRSADWGLLMALATGFVLQKRGIRLMTAESCTGGLVSHWLTRVGGSSQWFDGGVVSYSNQVKVAMLGVGQDTLDRYGAVSLEVAHEMAMGLMPKTGSGRASLSITGVAGPQGGTVEKPVGLVCFAWAGPFGVTSEKKLFQGDRNQIQMKAAIFSLSNICSYLTNSDHSHQ